MELIDYIVIIFLLFVLFGLAYSKSENDRGLEELGTYLNEGFADNVSKGGVKVFLFYSMLSKVPGKKCRENYKLFKENRQYLTVWTKFKQYVYANHANATLEAINIDEYPDYLQEYIIDKTPTIVIDNGENVIYLNKDKIPTFDELVQFYEKSTLKIVKDLGAYDDAIVYLYLPNCSDCKRFLPEWVKFKREIKKSYPDLDIFEVNVAKHTSYKKYTYKFGPSVYPLVLAKILGKISVTDLIELYGSFTADNLFQLVEETVFSAPVDDTLALDQELSENGALSAEVDVEQEAINNMTTQVGDLGQSNMDLVSESEQVLDEDQQGLTDEQQLDLLMDSTESLPANTAQYQSGNSSGFLNRIMDQNVTMPMRSKDLLKRIGKSTRNPRAPLESRIKSV